jgi:ferritin-like metal-binding protein YciE
MTGKLMAFGQAVGGSLMSDEVIKGAMAGYVFENVEIAAYTVLIAAAKAAGDTLTEAACEEILPRKRRWLNGSWNIFLSSPKRSFLAQKIRT